MGAGDSGILATGRSAKASSGSFVAFFVPGRL